MPQDRFGKIRNRASAVSITAKMTFFIATLSRGANYESGPIPNANLNYLGMIRAHGFRPVHDQFVLRGRSNSVTVVTAGRDEFRNSGKESRGGPHQRTVGDVA
jgi:hypothetical protein